MDVSKWVLMLTCCSLQYNLDIDVDGAKALSKAIKVNTSLTELK